MRWLVGLLLVTTGCHAVVDSWSCFTSSHPENCGGDYDYETSRALAAEHARDARRQEATAKKARIAERDRYRAAQQACAAGNPHACLKVALYEEHQGASDASLEPRYRFACVSGLARGCFFAGKHAMDADLALASYSQGCMLRDGESCVAAWGLDPGRLDLLEVGCRDHYSHACEILESKRHRENPDRG